MADFVGAVDQGTTSTRFMVFDHGGNEVARHQLEHEQILPQAGWVEHNPVEIWERTRRSIQTALGKANLHAADLAAIGITNQRETDGGLEPDAPAGPTTTRSSGRTPAPTGSPPRWSATATGDADPPQGRPAAGDLLLRRQDPVDPGERRRRARRRRAAATPCSATPTAGCSGNLTGGVRRRRPRHRRRPTPAGPC